MEKQDFELIRALKEFRAYIMQSHIIAFVPNSVVKDILTQPDPDGRRGRWIVVLLEYDLEIRPTKLIKVMGLAKLMAQSNLDSFGNNLMDEVSVESEEEYQFHKFFQIPLGIKILFMYYNIYKHLLI